MIVWLVIFILIFPLSIGDLEMARFRDMSEQELMAGLLYGEGRQVEDTRSDEIKEFLAIGCTVMNRIKSHRWPNTVRRVILQRNQFSCFNANDPNRERIRLFLTRKHPQKLYDTLMNYSAAVLDGRCVDFSEKANHYAAGWFVQKKYGTNHWVQKMKIVALYGGHVFFTDGKR